MSTDSHYFFEQTDFSLRFARCAISETSLRIEEIREILVNDNAALQQTAPAGSPVICAVRPKPRHLHLASAEEAKRNAGPAGIRQFAQLQPYAKTEPAWFAGVQAADGGPVGAAPWLVSLCSETAHQQVLAAFDAIKLRPARCFDATLTTAGAIASTATSPTVLVDFGEHSSKALLIGHDGVLAVRPVSLNLEQIAEAIQAEMNLKFRGSATKLFLNPDCDFAEAGPGIAARLGTTLRADLAPLLADRPTPGTFCCAGLPGAHRWLGRELAGVLALAPYAPDIKSWSAAVGMSFATRALEASVLPDWFGFLHFINSQTLESPTAIAWQAEWLALKTPVAQLAARGTTVAPFPGQNRTLLAESESPIAVAVAVAPPAIAAQTKAGIKPAPVTEAIALHNGAPAHIPPPHLTKPAAASPAAQSKKAPGPAAKAVPFPVPVQPGTPKGRVPGDFSLADGGPDGEPRRKRSKLPLFVGVLVLLLVGAVYYYSNESQKAEAARLAFEQQRAAERLRLEQGKARLAEQKAQQEAEARKLSEMESAQKVAAAETARQQAEAARRQAEAEATSQAEAARLANARGTLVVTTIPAGANVTVGNLPPRSSPATFSDLRIGKYPVVITLSRHEDVKLELEVTDNGTTESGTINLVSFAGAIELASEPADVDYEIYPVNTAIVSMDAQHTGKTPARIEDLDPGDYSVTFSRPGWTPHTETVAVVRNATAHVGWKFPTGTVKITSSPAGATVNSNGTKLGVTPLTATQGTGPVRFELSLVGFDPVDLAGSVENGKLLELSTLLHETDRPFGPGELDQLPQAISQKAPSLPDSLTLVDGRVVIQMTINRDGTPTDIKIVRTSNPEIGKIYLAAAAKWKFKPGMAGGRPVRSTVVLPILISAARF